MAAVPRLERIHATSIAIDGRAAIIRGPSGAGKSDLALRILALPASALIPHPARLVSDDYCEIEADGDRLRVRAPVTLAGRIEVRGVGIVPVPSLHEAVAALVVDLVTPPRLLERLPDPIPRVSLLGVSLPLLHLSPFESSAPAKLLMALQSRWGC